MIKSHFDSKLLDPVSQAEDTQKHALDTLEALMDELESYETYNYREWPSERVYTIRGDECDYLDEGCPD